MSRNLKQEDVQNQESPMGTDWSIATMVAGIASFAVLTAFLGSMLGDGDHETVADQSGETKVVQRHTESDPSSITNAAGSSAQFIVDEADGTQESQDTHQKLHAEQTMKVASEDQVVVQDQPSKKFELFVSTQPNNGTIETQSIDNNADDEESQDEQPSEDEVDYEIKLVEELDAIPTLALDTVAGTSQKLRELIRSESRGKQNVSIEKVLSPNLAPLFEFTAGRKDLDGVPFLDGPDCRLDKKSARTVELASRHMRRVLFSRRRAMSRGMSSWSSFSSSGLASMTSNPTQPQTMLAKAEIDQILETLGRYAKMTSPTAIIATLEQMLQVESEDSRIAFVQTLADIDTKRSTQGLARRVVFDTAASVRTQATDALKKRDPDDFRSILLKAIAYPWAPVSQHAASAITTLDDQSSVPHLIEMLKTRDPAQPELNRHVRRELVRVNHLENCFLCHAPALSRRDPVRGFIPSPGEPITESYYNTLRGEFVRADTTYLRQDFSVMHFVDNPGKWPALQRFDYFIRKRQLTKDEIKQITESKTQESPQRIAIVDTLKKLTKQDFGSNPDRWRAWWQSQQAVSQ